MTGGLVPHLLRPEWLWALLGLPPLAWAWRRRRSDPGWRSAIDPHLRPHLLVTGHRAAGRGPLLALLLAWTLATLALAGPSWRQSEVPGWRGTAPLLVALDLSSRQLAQDLAPDRITRARFKLHQLLRERRGGQTGLLVYAADAHTVAPLTEDAATVAALVDALHPSIMPADGQRTDRAIAHAAQLLAQAGFPRGEILLLTDRADQSARAAAEAARKQGYRVSVLGLGTRAGAPVPQTDGSFRRDSGGELLVARLQPASLQGLAEAGGGRHAELAADESDLAALGLLDPRLDPEAGEARGHARVWRDDGPWLLLLALPLVLIGFRRGGLAVWLVALWLPSPASHAASWAELWQRPDQLAHAALERGDVQTARRFARDPAWRGAAAYRGGDFEAAAEAWSAGEDAVSHYNRGNALAQGGDYEAAIAAFDRALALDPDFEDAAYNRRIVEQAQRQAGQGGSGQRSEPGPGDGEPQPDRGAGGAAEGPPEDGDGEGDSAPDPDGAGEPARDEPPPGESGSGPDRSPDGAAAGRDGEAPAPAPEADPAQQAAAGQALREAIDQALAAQQAPADSDSDETTAPGAVLSGDAMAEEERQRAVEQWLRRLPDDPGGLLRRKFAIEQQRRAAAGREP